MSWFIKHFRCASSHVMDDVDGNIPSHETAISEISKENSNSCTSATNIPNRVSTQFVDECKPQPLEDQHIQPRHLRRTHSSFSSLNNLHFIQHEVVVRPSSIVDYMDTLPPPKYVYLSDDKCCEVFMNKKGNRYIKMKGKRVFLQDIKGSYRYPSMVEV
jgi:hypothetical protein